MDEKPIQAVEMVRAIRDQIYEETRQMPPEELRAYIAREVSKTRSPAARRPASRPAA